jgi:hypothetical protein
MKKLGHKDFGIVVDYPNTGLACADCGNDAHRGNCRHYYCKSCGVECGESGCSLHHGKPHVETTTRKANL